MQGISDQMAREFVKTRLAGEFYRAYCKHLNQPPRDRIDNWAYQYASIAIDYLGFDDEAITRLAGDSE